MIYYNDVDIFSEVSPTSGGVVLRSKLVEGKCKVQFPGPACRPSRSEFSVVFLRNSRKYGVRSLRKTPTEDTLSTRPGPTIGQLALTLQSILNSQTFNIIFHNDASPSSDRETHFYRIPKQPASQFQVDWPAIYILFLLRVRLETDWLS